LETVSDQSSSILHDREHDLLLTTVNYATMQVTHLNCRVILFKYIEWSCFHSASTVSVFQLKSKMVICLDGNFGLVHKRSSGHAFGNQRKNKHLFLDQDLVDDFVTTYSGEPKKSEGVSMYSNKTVLAQTCILAIQNIWRLYN
jgi:hypothetical protein